VDTPRDMTVREALGAFSIRATPAEIESVLRTHAGDVNGAVCRPSDGNGDRYTLLPLKSGPVRRQKRTREGAPRRAQGSVPDGLEAAFQASKLHALLQQHMPDATFTVVADDTDIDQGFVQVRSPGGRAHYCWMKGGEHSSNNVFLRIGHYFVHQRCHGSCMQSGLYSRWGIFMGRTEPALQRFLPPPDRRPPNPGPGVPAYAAAVFDAVTAPPAPSPLPTPGVPAAVLKRLTLLAANYLRDGDADEETSIADLAEALRRESPGLPDEIYEERAYWGAVALMAHSGRDRARQQRLQRAVEPTRRRYLLRTFRSRALQRTPPG